MKQWKKYISYAPPAVMFFVMPFIMLALRDLTRHQYDITSAEKGMGSFYLLSFQFFLLISLLSLVTSIVSSQRKVYVVTATMNIFISISTLGYLHYAM